MLMIIIATLTCQRYCGIIEWSWPQTTCEGLLTKRLHTFWILSSFHLYQYNILQKMIFLIISHRMTQVFELPSLDCYYEFKSTSYSTKDFYVDDGMCPKYSEKQPICPHFKSLNFALWCLGQHPVLNPIQQSGLLFFWDLSSLCIIMNTFLVFSILY